MWLLNLWLLVISSVLTLDDLEMVLCTHTLAPLLCYYRKKPARVALPRLVMMTHTLFLPSRQVRLTGHIPECEKQTYIIPPTSPRTRPNPPALS